MNKSTVNRRRLKGARLWLVAAVVVVAPSLALVACGRVTLLTPAPDQVAEVACDVEAIALETTDTGIDAGLAAAIRGCAACHTATDAESPTVSPQGRGGSWGVNEQSGEDDAFNLLLWHHALTALSAVDDAAIVGAFDGSTAASGHPENAPALELANAYLADFRASGGAECQGGGPVDPCLDAEALALAVETQDLHTTFNACASCHTATTVAPENDGGNWGLADATAPGEWATAFVGLTERDPQRLLSAFDGSLSAPHFEDPGTLARAQSFVDTYVDPGCGVGEPTPEPVPDVEPVEPDPAPELVCVTPWPEEERDAYFETHLRERFQTCSVCHTNPAFMGQSGGLTFPRDDVLPTALAYLGVGTALESPIGEIMGLTGTTVRESHQTRLPEQDFVNGDAALQIAVDTWVTQATEGVRNPDPLCDIDYCDVTPELSLQVFEETLYAPFTSCAACHTGQGNQGGINYNTPQQAHTIAVDRLDPSLSPAETVIGQILQVDGARAPGHGHFFAEPDLAKQWIEMHTQGVPCE